MKDCFYSGSAIVQSPTVKLGDKVLVENVDYTLVYKNNKSAGKATVFVKGKGNYTGLVRGQFKIKKVDIGNAKVSAIENRKYTGKEITPKPVVRYGEKGVELVAGKDYTLSYEDNKKIGVATVVVKGKGNYSGSIKKTFKITASLKDAKIRGIEDVIYHGETAYQDCTIELGGRRLIKGKDYKLAYKNNSKVGKATVVISGLNCVTGEVKKSFMIYGDIEDAKVSDLGAYEYTGKRIKPKPVVKYRGKKLKLGRDYTLSYSKNVKPGTGSVTIEGDGYYVGAANFKFKISALPITKAKVSNIKSELYTGKKITPKPVVRYGKKKLKLGRDYTLSYEANVKPGKATVRIEGKGVYRGSVEKTFKIYTLPISKAKVSTIKNQSFRGSDYAITPKPTVKYAGKKLQLGRDYTFSYSKNRRCGKATVVIKGKRGYTGSIKKSFNIVGDIAKAKVDKIPLRVSNGQEQRPIPAVQLKWTELKLNRDYTLSYKNNVDAGTATVIVSAKGKYFKGSKRVTFRIVQGGEGDTVSYAEFSRIKNGMTYSNVVDVIGGEGTLTYEYSGSQDYYKTYEWDGDEEYSRVSVSFRNGHVYSKHQYGL